MMTATLTVISFLAVAVIEIYAARLVAMTFGGNRQ